MKYIRCGVLANIGVMAMLAILSGIISALISQCSSDWTWFSRSGAMITVCGVALSVRPVIRKGYKPWLKSLQEIDCGHIVPTAEEIEESRQVDQDALALWIGAIMAFVGAIIGAYGDLVGLALKTPLMEQSTEFFSKPSSMRITACFYIGWIAAYSVAFLMLIFGLKECNRVCKSSSRDFFAAVIFLLVIVAFDVVLYDHAFDVRVFVDGNKNEEKLLDWLLLITNLIPTAFVGSCFFKYVYQEG